MKRALEKNFSSNPRRVAKWIECFVYYQSMNLLIINPFDGRRMIFVTFTLFYSPLFSTLRDLKIKPQIYPLSAELWRASIIHL